MAPGGAKRSREVHDFLARETREGECHKRPTARYKKNNRTTKRRQPNRVVKVTAAEECKNEMADRIAQYATG